MKLALVLFPSLFLAGCAHRPARLEFNVPVACVRKVVMRGCDPLAKPLRCDKVAVTYQQGCEQMVVSSLP